MAVPPIFKDPLQQEHFDKQGYLVVPFIDKSTVNMLSKAFDELHPNLPPEGFISGSYSPDFEYKKKASDLIKKTFMPRYEELFQNFTAFGGAFLFKMPSENSDLVLHQDWSIVDEEQSVALNCWVALTDIDENNGALHVLPGSHYSKHPVHRAPTLNFFFTGNEEVVMDQLEPQYVPAGHAVILNQSLVHYSPPNRSGEIRKAITAGVKTKGAPMQFYFNDPEGEEGSLKVYDMEEDFLIMFDDFAKDIFQEPKHGVYRGQIRYSLPQYSRDELEKLVNTMTGRSPKEHSTGFFERIKAIFS
jgi:hypothetical protein